MLTSIKINQNGTPLPAGIALMDTQREFNKTDFLNDKPKIVFNTWHAFLDKINDVVREYSIKEGRRYYLNYEDLPDHEKAELAVLLLEDDDRDTTAIMMDQSQYAKDDPITCSLVKLLKNDNSENRLDLVDKIYKNACRAYAKNIQNAIADRCAELYLDEDYE